ELTRDGRAGHGRLLAPCRERAVARRQAALRLPRDLAHLGRYARELSQLRCPDSRRMPVGPGALDQEVAHARVAHLGDRAAPDAVAGGSLTGYQAEIAHELTRGGASPHKVAHRLVRWVGHPDRGQLAGAQEAGQAKRVAAVSLYAVARLLRDERGRHDDAGMSKLGE